VNKKQLLALGVPPDCVSAAVNCIQQAAINGDLRTIKPKKEIPLVVADPTDHLHHPQFAALAQAIIENENNRPAEKPLIKYAQWGDDIDDASKQQISAACRLPVASAAALMPDAHSGYGLPIGGVLACENAVVPYAVGVDIACRMRLSITDLPVENLDANDANVCAELDKALDRGTLFGTGKAWEKPHDHDVIDEDWTVSAVTREMRDTAWRQLGTSGSGNHFVEWGIIEVDEPLNISGDTNGDAGGSALPPGRYVALLSHSGSRGAGARTCKRYSEIAQRQLPQSYKDDKQLRHLAWLSLDEEAGQEYWAAMNLMGRYAAANHEVIHRNVLGLAGAEELAVVENHHNFAWKEMHNGREMIVHRKGATPAGEGVLGVIPGNMADPAYLVRGRGEATSLASASHGAGRRMSRTAAKNAFNWKMWDDYLSDRNVRLLAGGIDEAPGAYKNIDEVMAAQTDLVDVLGRFHPKIVMMCDDGSRPED